MFDGFTKSKFYTKCKSSLNMTKTRLEALKKKKNTVIKYLKNDMADLLKNGLDYNAYNRAEGLIVEQNMMACYNFIEQFCGCIATNLSVMNKQRECPEECRAAVQSLVFAAARFSEFPELRDLRTLFTERYSNLEPYINKQFFGLLKPQHATKEMKLQLMHDIAREFSIEWSSKSLEQKLFKPPEPQGNGRDSSYCLDDLRDDLLRKRNETEHASHGRKPSFDRQKIEASSKDEEDIDHETREASSSSAASASEEEIDNKKPFHYGLINPPYLKPIVGKEEIKPADQTYDSDDLSDEARPKPRSVRKKPSKLSSGVESIGGVDSPLKPPPGREKVQRGRKQSPGINPIALEKYESKWGSKMSEADDDSEKSEEEDQLLDGLLMHYSKKESPYKVNINDQTHLKPTSQRSEVPLPPGRATHRSEPLTPNEGCSGKRHARTASAQSEMSSVCSLHPKLPDYDELAARIAAFTGK